jgi:hypothetical protein
MKRAGAYDYKDLSTVGKRRVLLERELISTAGPRRRFNAKV